MNRGNTWAIYRDPRDLETPIRIDVGTFASAWLDIEEAEEALKQLKQAIKEAKRTARKWEEWTRQ